MVSGGSCQEEVYSSTGSGVFVHLVKEYSTVLTAGHVCSNLIEIPKEDAKFHYSAENEIFVQNHENKFFKAQIILSEMSTKDQKHSDLCSLMVLKENDQKGLLIENRRPTPGEDIYYMGSPKGIYHPPTVLITKGVYSGSIDKISALVSLNATQGSSGSAILSLNNKIYGVLFAVHYEFNTATIITSYQKTRNFLARSKKMLELFTLQQENTSHKRDTP